MIPAAFEYVRADSAQEAVELVSEHGDDAKLLAGGMSLLPLMKFRLATPSVLVDVGRIGDLSYIRDAGDEVHVGALTTHGAVEKSEVLARHCGVLAAVAHEVGDPQVRHRGTLGGSAAHGDPASDLPAVLVALDATLVAQGPRGNREIAATEFFKGFLETDLAADEMLTEVRLPKTGANGFDYQKFNRRAQDWAIVGALAVRVGETRRVALVNMGGVPIRARATERALAEGATVHQAAELAVDGTEPNEDMNASVEYRQHLARVLTARALTAAGA